MKPSISPAKAPNYQSTVRACYVADVVQAVLTNLTPLLFLILKDDFGLSYSQFGLLTLINFCTQVTVDIAFSKAVDKHGFRPFILMADGLCALGLTVFAVSPWVFAPNPFAGFVIGTVLFAGAGGLLELLLSPIVDALPAENSAKAMSILHSMYAWGQLLCVVVTTLLVFAGVKWYVIMLLWTLLPLCNLFSFIKAPLRRKVAPDQVMKIGALIRKPLFLLAFFAIAFGGATELVIAQWTSAYMQNGLGVPKLTGDLLGMGGFALMLGLGRLLHGMYGERFSLQKLMIGGCLGCVVCYLMIALSPLPWVGILGCVGVGFLCSLLWPGTLTLTSERIPTGGASMFALLAAGGDVGGSMGPWMIGLVADARIAGGATDMTALRFAVLCAVLVPLGGLLCQTALKKRTGKV